MIRIKLPKLFRRQKKQTPKQQILDELTVLRIKRERIQSMLGRGERFESALASIQQEIVNKVAEYKQTPD